VGLQEVGDVRRATSEQLVWLVSHGRGIKNGMKPLRCVRLQRASGKQFVVVVVAVAAAADDDDDDVDCCSLSEIPWLNFDIILRTKPWQYSTRSSSGSGPRLIGHFAIIQIQFTGRRFSLALVLRRSR